MIPNLPRYIYGNFSELGPAHWLNKTDWILL